MLIQFTGLLLFAIIHNAFAFEYFRASLTVPLLFERQICKDSNKAEISVEIDRKIRIRRRIVAVTQVFVFLGGLAYTTVTILSWVTDIHDNFFPAYLF